MGMALLFVLVPAYFVASTVAMVIIIILIKNINMNKSLRLIGAGLFIAFIVTIPVLWQSMGQTSGLLADTINQTIIALATPLFTGIILSLISPFIYRWSHQVRWIAIGALIYTFISPFVNHFLTNYFITSGTQAIYPAMLNEPVFARFCDKATFNYVQTIPTSPHYKLLLTQTEDSYPTPQISTLDTTTLVHLLLTQTKIDSVTNREEEYLYEMVQPRTESGQGLQIDTKVVTLTTADFEINIQYFIIDHRKDIALYYINITHWDTGKRIAETNYYYDQKRNKACPGLASPETFILTFIATALNLPAREGRSEIRLHL